MIRLIRLPSDILPRMNELEFIIAETKSGKLIWVDSEGAKELATKEEVAVMAQELENLKQTHEVAMQQLLEAKAMYEQAVQATKTKIL